VELLLPNLKPPHPRRPPRPQLSIPLPPPPSRAPIPPHPLRVRVRVPAQALPLLRRHLALSLVQLPRRPTNLPLRLARLKLLLVPTTITPLPVVSPSQAGPLALGRTSPSTQYTRASSVLVPLSWLLILSWSLNLLILDLYTQHYYPFIALFYWLHDCHTSSLVVLGLALLSARRCLEGDCPPSLTQNTI
jgi:hypothetical protein